jgi:hypothetical protein
VSAQVRRRSCKGARSRPEERKIDRGLHKRPALGTLRGMTASYIRTVREVAGRGTRVCRESPSRRNRGVAARASQATRQYPIRVYPRPGRKESACPNLSVVDGYRVRLVFP